MRKVVAGISAALAGLLLLPTAPAWASGAEQGGSGSYVDPGDGSNACLPGQECATCKDGQLLYNGKPISFPNFPGCTGDWVNQFNTDSYAFCVTNYMVFRFYGTVSNPSAAMTVSLANLPYSRLGCALPTADGEEPPGFTSMGQYGRFFMMPSSPIDSGLNPSAANPWMVKDTVASRELKQNWEDTVPAGTAYDSDLIGNVWRVYSPKIDNGRPPGIPGNYADGLVTSGEVFYSKGRCTTYSHPAVHQPGGGTTPITSAAKYGTFYGSDGSTAKVAFNGESYFDALNTWMAKYTVANNLRNVSNPSMNARLLGLGGSSAVLNDTTVKAAEYEECGTPLNYQIQIEEEDVLEKDESGLPTKVRLPDKSEATLNVVAYMPLARLGNYFDRVSLRGSDSFLLNYGFYTKNEVSWYPKFGQDTRTCTVKSPTSSGCVSTTVSALYGSAENSRIINKVRAALKDFYQGTQWRKLLPGYTYDKTGGASGYALNNMIASIPGSRENSHPASASFLADYTKVFVMDSSTSLARDVLPIGEVTQDPTPSEPVAETEEPLAPVPPTVPQPSGSSGGFEWAIYADTNPYLEVRAANTPPNIFGFRAVIEKEWKSQAEADAFISDEMNRRAQAAYNAAKNEWNRLSSGATSTPSDGALASSRLTSDSPPNFSGMHWVMNLDWKGMDMTTYIPGCNTGQDTGCGPQANAWNSANPGLPKSECDSPGCYAQGQLRNNAIVGIAQSPRGNTSYDNYRIGGNGVPLGAWSYDFFKATAKDKAVTVAHTNTEPVDINVVYTSTRPGTAGYSVGGTLTYWKEVKRPEEWNVVCSPGSPNFDPEDPQALNCKQTFWVFDRWDTRDSGYGSSGSYTTYALSDAQSVVVADPSTGRAIRAGQPNEAGAGTGGAGCANNSPGTTWNYCSPVLAGKLTN